MDGRVLVTYGSRMGSAAQIPEAIADVLRARGFAVTLLPAHQVHSVAPYDGVVLGSAIYAGRWRREATQLLARERIGLKPVPVTFAGCLIPATAKGLLPRLMARISPARGDHRDWHAIRGWANQIADQLIDQPTDQLSRTSIR